MKVYLSVLLNGVLGASSFAKGVSEDNCSAGFHKNLETKFPSLTKCYGDTGLYFSSLSVVCDPKCLKTTVEASKYAVANCNIEQPSPSKPVDQKSVHHPWSNNAAARVACKQGAEASQFCLKDLAHASMLLVPGISEDKKPLFCTKCNKDFYDGFKASPNKVPSLYLHQISNPSQLLPELQKLCGWPK